MQLHNTHTQNEEKTALMLNRLIKTLEMNVNWLHNNLLMPTEHKLNWKSSENVYTTKEMNLIHNLLRYNRTDLNGVGTGSLCNRTELKPTIFTTELNWNELKTLQFVCELNWNQLPYNITQFNWTCDGRT